MIKQIISVSFCMVLVGSVAQAANSTLTPPPPPVVNSADNWTQLEQHRAFQVIAAVNQALALRNFHCTTDNPQYAPFFDDSYNRLCLSSYDNQKNVEESADQSVIRFTCTRQRITDEVWLDANRQNVVRIRSTTLGPDRLSYRPPLNNPVQVVAPEYVYHTDCVAN